jgi:hypothetical protein
MENAVYWNGRQVGVEAAGRVLWFSSAPQEAIATYGAPRVERAVIEDSVVARNLVRSSPCDRPDGRG